MALKAGRVGVSPDQVDEFGKISSDATGAYTKQEADAKFETQTHASNTYETKTEAAALQPKTLSVPISMLIGSQLVPKTTVESVIATMNNAKTTAELTDDVTAIYEKITLRKFLWVTSATLTIPKNTVTPILIIGGTGNAYGLYGYISRINNVGVYPSLHAGITMTLDDTNNTVTFTCAETFVLIAQPTIPI